MKTGYITEESKPSEKMKKDVAPSNGEVGVNIDVEMKKPIQMPNLPKPLTTEEKKYLLAVERGDMASVRKILQKAHRKKHININCVDSLGRGAMSIAVDSESLEMLELLVVLNVDTKDSLLQAINVGFVEAVELLLEHEELIHKEGEPYSWEKVDWNTSLFTSDITPLILAAHRNNYEILKILLDRGATLPMPHEIKCGCAECIKESEEDSLRFSVSRLNQYKALASPSLMALSSSDPVLTAFELSWDLKNLAFAEPESKSQYMELRSQCQQFAVSLLDQTRSSQELAIVLNHDPETPPYEDGEHMTLARLELAIGYKQKKFVAHPNIQQLLAAIWYDGLPGFRRKSVIHKIKDLATVALLFPLYCIMYMVAPNTQTAKLMRKPFMKFLIHASSYLFFLLLLILVSQRAELGFISVMVNLFGSQASKQQLLEEESKQRGKGPLILECIVGLYVLGFIWEETVEIWTEGIQKYLRNMWNFIDFTRNSLYVGVFFLRVAAYVEQSNQIAIDPTTAYIPRENWDPYDYQLIAEGLFAAANVFSALKLVHMFSINPHLGPLQISLGRMVIDIVKFFFIYSLVLFAFACGLNQLLWYYAELERRKCFSMPDGSPDWDNQGDACSKYRRFLNLFESSQSLFWASFGGLGVESFQLTGIKTYTRFWGLLMFGSYSVINVIVLLNLLIAMMSNSYAMIDEHSDTEWKFARTKLWMSYFEESSGTLPPPFNIFPTPKHIMKLFGLRKKDKLRRMSSKRKERKEKERDYRYSAVMRSLVWRYISSMHRQADDNPVTEDDVNEIKSEITTMKYEILNVLERNGMDVSSVDKKDKSQVLGKKMKVWERRLMKDFHLAPVAGEEEMDLLLMEPPPDEDVLAKFRRIAKLAVLTSAQQKWNQVVQGACQASQIGRCNNRMSLRNQQYLQKAMQEAQRLVSRSPMPHSRSASPSMISLPDPTTAGILEILNDISKDAYDGDEPRTPRPSNSDLTGNNNNQERRSPTPKLPRVSPFKNDESLNKTDKPFSRAVPTVSIEPPKNETNETVKTEPSLPPPPPSPPRRKNNQAKDKAPPKPDDKLNGSPHVKTQTKSPPDKVVSPQKMKSPTHQLNVPKLSPSKKRTPPPSPKIPPVNTVNSNNKFAFATSSQERLIPGSPQSRSPKAGDCKQRQPKDGWL